MIITCTKCSTRFNLDDSIVKADGTKCRCTVCKHVFTAYPVPLISTPPVPEAPIPEPWTSETQGRDHFKQTAPKQDNFKSDSLDTGEPGDLEPDKPESDSPEPDTWESELWDSEPTAGEPDSLDFESGSTKDDPFKETQDFEMEDFSFSEADSEVEIENPYLFEEESKHDGEDDFSFEETDFDMPEPTPEPPAQDKAPFLAMENDEIQETLNKEEPDPFTIENKEDITADMTGPDKDKDKKVFSPSEDDLPENKATLETNAQPDKAIEENIHTEDVLPEKIIEKKPEKEDKPPQKDLEPENDLPEKPGKEAKAPPRKVIVKPKPAVKAKPKPAASAKIKPAAGKKPKKEKKKTNIPVLILLLLLLLGLVGYLVVVLTGYKLPAIDQYIKKPIPEVSEAKPIPNQKSVNGRFITNATAGTLFVITGRVENPSNIAYSHIEIRGALITKNKEEAKIKNAFCGNIITEEMLKTGNITDINTLLGHKEGAHKINVNVKPSASVPFMVVFSDLPEELQNFTVKIAGFDKAIK